MVYGRSSLVSNELRKCVASVYGTEGDRVVYKRQTIDRTLKGHHMHRWKRLLDDDSGVSTVEYSILLAMIVLVSVITLGGFGVGVDNIYNIIDGSLPDR